MNLQIKKKRRRAYFQLLEVLIGLFLIVTIALPIIHSFVRTYTEQTKMLRTIELDHLAHLAHAQVTEALYRDAGRTARTVKEFTDQSGSIQMDPSWFQKGSPVQQQQYDFTYEMKLKEQKKKRGQPEAEKLLLQLTITITEKGPNKVQRVYPYLLYVHRKPLT